MWYVLTVLHCYSVAALVGPSPQTLLVPQGVSATVQFSCSVDEDLPPGTTRSWLWMVRDQIFTASSGVLIIDTEVVDGVTISTTLQISNVNEFFSSMIDTANITCIERLASNVINDESSNITATLATFGPLLQPTITSHDTTSVLVKWMPSLLQYADDFQYNVTLLRASSVQAVMFITSNDTMALLERPAVDGNNCTQYIVHVTAIANGGHGPTVSTEIFTFNIGKLMFCKKY